MLSTAFDGDTNLDTFKIALVHAIHNVSAEKHLDVDKDLDVSDISVFDRKAGVYASVLLVFVSLFFCCLSLHLFSFCHSLETPMRHLCLFVCSSI